ncbi:hypothetical protein Hanom_Chr07g00658681 [Helianthus anomalus]
MNVTTCTDRSHVIKSTNKEVQRVEGEHESYVQIWAHEVSKLPESLLSSKRVYCMIKIRNYVKCIIVIDIK